MTQYKQTPAGAARDTPALALFAFGVWALTALLGRLVRRAR